MSLLELKAIMLSKPPPFTMPVTSYIVSVNGITFPVTNFQSTSKYGRKNVYSCKSSPRRVVSQSVTQTSDDTASGLHALRGLTEDGLSYKEKFVIRCYEVGINKTASIQTIANYLQEVSSNHALYSGYSIDGFGTTHNIRKLHLIWVTTRMHIEVYRYPAWNDVIEIETWMHCDGKIGTRLNWILKDYINDEVIGRGTSKLSLMNAHTRRLRKVSDDVQEELLAFCSRTLRLAFPEPNNSSLKKIAKLEGPTEYSRLGFVPRRSDLDMNKHVNNVTYIGWALESIPPEIIDTRELQAITIDYRRECQQGDIVDSLTSREPLDNISVSELKNGNGPSAPKNDGQDLTRFLHLLRSSDNGLEFSRCRTEWRMKPARK